VITDYVADNDVDLVVMSSEGQSNLAGQQLGTVAGRVLRAVDRPVLVVTED
jgi:nucleotide-binding universal stress UspA family protein